MTALSKFLVLLAIFLLASYANAFLSLSQLLEVKFKWIIWFNLKKVTIKIAYWIENQPMIKHQMKFKLHLPPTPLKRQIPQLTKIVREKSILRLFLMWNHPTIQQEWTIKWHSVTSGTMKSIARVPVSVISLPNKWHMPDKINLDFSGLRCSAQSAVFSEIKFTLIPWRFLRVWNKVQNMLAWSSFLLSVPLAWDWNVEFILIKSFKKVLQSMGYDTRKIQSE